MRTRWRPRSRSPSRNQSSPPSVGDGLERVPASRRRGPSRAPRRAARRARRGCCRGRARRQAEHLEVVADVADDGHARRLDRARRARARSGAPPTPPERSATFIGGRASERGLRARPDPQRRAARDRRACRRRRRGSGSRPRRRRRPRPARARGSAPRCRRRRAARRAEARGSASAFVVPSAASTRPKAPELGEPGERAQVVRARRTGRRR